MKTRHKEKTKEIGKKENYSILSNMCLPHPAQLLSGNLTGVTQE